MTEGTLTEFIRSKRFDEAQVRIVKVRFQRWLRATKRQPRAIRRKGMADIFDFTDLEPRWLEYLGRVSALGRRCNPARVWRIG